MDYLRIKNSENLSGSVKISGAKNAALPLIASTILSKNDVVLENVPSVVDVAVLVRLLAQRVSKEMKIPFVSIQMT